MTNTVKKIGYFTALVMMTGGTIGAGIFYKSQSILTNSHNDFILAIISWLVSVFGVICIGLALVEVSSVAKKDSGIILWVRKLTTKKIGRFSSSYMLMIYYPFSILTLSIYGVNAIEDAYMVASNGKPLFQNGYIPAAISLGICLWLLILSWLSFRATEKTQWVFTIIKFIPIIVLPIFAFIFAVSKEGQPLTSLPTPENDGIIGIFKGWGIVASIPAILFTFDGFFTVASIRSNLNNKKLLPSIMLVGLIVITIAYLYISIAFSIPNNNGSVDGIGKIPSWLKITLLSFISISVIGVANGYTLATNRVYMIATNDREFYFLSYLYKKFKTLTKRDVSYLFLISLTIGLFVIFTPFALEIWKLDPEGYTHSLYAMSDVLTNYTSLFVFVIIGFSIIGALINRKKQTVEVEKSKLFIPSAIISILFLLIGSLYFLLSPLIDLTFLTDHSKKMQNVYTFLVMIGTLIITVLNTFVELYYDNKKPNELYFPENYISINVLIDESNASIEQKEKAFYDFDEEGMIKIKRYMQNLKNKKQ